MKRGVEGASPWALVPVKRFEQGKSRLGEVIGAGERADLARSMFDRVVRDVLSGLRASGELDGTLVVTDGREVIDRARACGAVAVELAGVGPGRKLGDIVDEGLRELSLRGATVALVIMGDLPSLTAEDVRALIELLDKSDIVLAPDAAGTGTNALAVRLPAPMPTRFCGGESLALHLSDARERGLKIAICERPGFGFDVDEPADLHQLKRGIVT